MSTALLVGGILLVLAALTDALWTTLWVEGHSGPIAGRLSELANRALVWLLARRGHGALAVKGPIVLLISLSAWVLVLWIGWVLVFSASPTAVVNASSGHPADVSDRIYFVAYTLATLGNGDFMPVGDGWQLATGFASLTGMGLLTLLVTYLLSIIEAVVQKRSFASHGFALGATSEEFVRHAWDGAGFRSLDLHLTSLLEQLNRLAEQHKAYPLLHYYHAKDRRQASSYGAAVFSDAILLLRHGVSPDVRSGPSALHVADASIGGFLETLQAAHIDENSPPPEPPSLASLRTAGIPVVSDAEFARALEAFEKRRRLLLSLNRSERREWP